MPLRPITDEALSERVLKALREAIVTMQLSPGQPLVERQIAQQLGISTTPVRHAIRQLANDGLVTIALNRSAVVRALTPDDIDEIYALRELLEPLAVRLAATRRGDDLIRAMDDILTRSAQAVAAGDFAALARCNREFNDSFVQGCGNGRLQAMLEGLHGQTQQIGGIAWKYRRSAPIDHEQHLRIVDAVRREDWDAMKAAVREHLRSARQEFLLAFAEYQAEHNHHRPGTDGSGAPEPVAVEGESRAVRRAHASAAEAGAGQVGAAAGRQIGSD